MATQKTGYLIFLTVFVALVVTNGMAESIRKVGETYCTTTNIGDTSCRGSHCHNTTTYIHDCDTYNDDNCDNFTTLFVICNSTGTCRNTTRDVRACYSDVSDNCGTTDITSRCCTNGVCRNHKTHVHACYNLDSMTESYNRAAASICANSDRVCNPFFPYDPTCTDRITANLHHRLGISK